MQDTMIDMFYAILTWTQQPDFLPQLVGFAFLAFIVKLVMNALGSRVKAARLHRQARNQGKDRLYSPADKAEGHKRAGNQCEFSTGVLGLHRCERRSVHADHFYPYGRGGATSMKNFVAACEFHNLSKGMKMPSAVEKSRIETRRKKYFPMLVSEKVGEWA